MELVGVKLYGKPGRVIVEGNTETVVRKYLGDVRKLRWQKCVEMGVFPVEEVIDEEVLVDSFSFTEEDIKCVRRNRKKSPFLTTPQVAKLDSIVSEDDELKENVKQSLALQPSSRNKERRRHHHQRQENRRSSDENDGVEEDGVGEGGYYFKHRSRPSAFIFKPLRSDDDDREMVNSSILSQESPPLILPSCTLIDASNENDLRHILESRGAGSLWRHINAPFSGMRPGNYSKTEVYAKS